ncbi:NK1 transcription factor-related protein 1-like [Equus quagga]|uniref:NK1 transcription factor-related protein 1-like n=1 Tax=Equus quagga TaxID=89248 RepID=UPI001EE19C37|nr:NK1 transcription factor-related protein 1-like [Equus quagga]
MGVDLNLGTDYTEADGPCPGTPAQEAQRVCGDVRDSSTHPPPKLRQRKGESGAKPPEGRGRYSHWVVSLEQVRDDGQAQATAFWDAWGTCRSAALELEGCEAGARVGRSARAELQRRGASTARTAAAAGTRERAGGGSAAAAAAAREAPAPQAARGLATAAADTCWPGRPPIRGARGWGACGGGAGARAGRPAGGAALDRACAGPGGACPAGSSGAPPARQRQARAGAGRIGRRRDWAARARGGDPLPLLGAPSRRSAVPGPRAGSPQARLQVVTSFEVRLFLSPAPEPRGPGLSLTAELWVTQIRRWPGSTKSAARRPECGRPSSGASPKLAWRFSADSSPHFTVFGYLKSSW